MSQSLNDAESPMPLIDSGPSPRDVFEAKLTLDERHALDDAERMLVSLRNVLDTPGLSLPARASQIGSIARMLDRRVTEVSVYRAYRSATL